MAAVFARSSERRQLCYDNYLKRQAIVATAAPDPAAEEARCTPLEALLSLARPVRRLFALAVFEQVA